MSVQSRFCIGNWWYFTRWKWKAPSTFRTNFCLRNVKIFLVPLYPAFQDHVNLNMKPRNPKLQVLTMKVYLKHLALLELNVSDNIIMDKNRTKGLESDLSWTWKDLSINLNRNNFCKTRMGWGWLPPTCCCPLNRNCLCFQFLIERAPCSHFFGGNRP